MSCFYSPNWPCNVNFTGAYVLVVYFNIPAETNVENFDMISVFGECRKNSKASRRLCHEWFPNRPVPCEQIYSKFASNIAEYRSFEKT